MKVTINVEFLTSCGRSISIVHNNIDVSLALKVLTGYRKQFSLPDQKWSKFPWEAVLSIHSDFMTRLDKTVTNLVWDKRCCCFQQEDGLVTSDHPSILNYPVIWWHYNPSINFPVSSLQALFLIKPLSSTGLTSAELHLIGMLTPWPPRIFSLLPLQQIFRFPSCLLVNFEKVLTCITKQTRATHLLHSLPGKINFSKKAHHNFQADLCLGAATNCKKKFDDTV